METHTTLSRFTFVLAIMLMALVGCTVVGPGEVGVEVFFGEIQGGVRSPGMYTTILSSVETMSTRTQTYTMAGAGNEAAVNGSVNVLARDQLPVSLDVSVMFHLDGQRAIDVYRTFGANYDDSIIHPLVRTAVRDAASEFTAVDLIDRRGELQTRMSELVRTQLAATLRGRTVNERALVIDNVLIRNIDLPASIDEAIASVQRQRQQTAERTQANLTAQQEAARMLTTANGENAAHIATAEAEARMVRIRAEAQAAANRSLADSITPNLLAYERIQATRSVLSSNGTRTVFLPGSGAPNLLMNAP